MGLHVAQMTGQTGMRACFDAVTVNAAKILHLDGYGIAPGNRADFVLLQARDPVEGDPPARHAPRGVPRPAGSSRRRRPPPRRCMSKDGARGRLDAAMTARIRVRDGHPMNHL